MTKIEWTERTWNPIVGCSIVSPGCTNCYAMRMAARLESIGDSDMKAARPITAAHYAGTTKWVNGNPVWTGKVALAPDRVLTEPLRRKKPATWFVNSMGDLFHESVPDSWIDRVFAVMALAPQHTFQVLTKRASRMRDYFALNDDGDDRLVNVARAAGRLMEDGDTALDVTASGPWPLPNVWLGVSAERQPEADERIPDLLATPAAVRFVSCEPLLGPVNLTRIHLPNAGFGPRWSSALDIEQWGWFRDEAATEPMDKDTATGTAFDARLDWVIVGGESGPGARPMHPDWARSIRDQCTSADVPFFMKQIDKIQSIPDDLFVRQMPRAA